MSTGFDGASSVDVLGGLPADERRALERIAKRRLWVALPLAHEEAEPAFYHHPGASLPRREDDGIRLRVLAGSAFGMTSPVQTLSPLFYVEAAMSAGSALSLPSEHEERAVYVVHGAVGCGTERTEAGRMLVFVPGAAVALRADSAARIVLLGGAPLDSRRCIHWNFVSSSRERIEQAKRDWKERRFPRVPGDEVEFVPLPDS